MGEEAIQYARSCALDTERKMGEMLLQRARDETRETRGGDRRSKSPGVTLKYTLKDISLTKKASAEAQWLATVPEEKFEAIKTE